MQFLTKILMRKKVVIVNWANFKAQDIVRFNAMIDDEERKIHDTPIAQNTKVIGLYSRNNSYIGSDL